MKIMFLLCAIVVGVTASAQFIGTRTNTADSTQERYTTNSPLNTPGNSRVIEKIRDSSYHRLMSNNVRVDRLNSTHSDGVASNVIFSTADGSLRRGSFPAAAAPDSGVFATRSFVTSQGYVKTETDPVWTTDRPNYWNKTQSDARYLQFEVDGSPTNELQTLSLGVDDSLAISSGNKVKMPYLRSFTEVDGSVTNELQTLSLGLDDSLAISSGNKIKLPYLRSEVDGSTTNELQTLGIVNRTISISSGNSVTVPLPPYDSIPGKPTFPATFRDSVEYYGPGGRITQKIKTWVGIVTPNIANGFNVDISSPGFTTILNVQAKAVNNGTVAASLPIVTVKSYTTTQVSLNILQSNSQLLSLLGITVTGLIFATNLTGTTLHVTVVGY